MNPIKNAFDFVNLPEKWVKSNLSIVELKIQQELKGIANLNLESFASKKSIATTRSFDNPVSEERTDVLCSHLIHKHF